MTDDLWRGLVFIADAAFFGGFLLMKRNPDLGCLFMVIAFVVLAVSLGAWAALHLRVV